MFAKNADLFDSMSVVAQAQAEICLREYQSLSIEGLRQGTRSGIINQVLCSPTGSGKSVLATHLLKECRGKGKRAVFIAERISLVNQFSDMLDFYGVPHGVLQANHWRDRPDEPIQVASSQTLSARGWPECDLIIVDEAHVMMKNTLERLAKKLCPAIGLTATPFSRGLGKYYGGIVNVTTTNKLTNDGFLCPFKVWASSEPDMKGVRTVAGEWVEGETSERAMRIVGDVVSEYMKHGSGGKAIIFGVDVAHCEELQRQFKDADIRVELYTYRDPDHVRAERMKEFRRPDSSIRGLVSVSALSRGLDVPDVSVIVACRPLRVSLAEHIQVIGRGLRTYPDKQFCTILDLAGNFMRHYTRMADFFEHGWAALDDGKKEKSAERKVKERQPHKCPKCSCVFATGKTCPSCGYEFRRLCTVEHEQGELGEFDLQSQSVSHNIKPPYVGHILKREALPHWKPASEKQSYYLRKLGYRGEVPSAWHAHRLITAYMAHEEQRKETA